MKEADIKDFPRLSIDAFKALSFCLDMMRQGKSVALSISRSSKYYNVDSAIISICLSNKGNPKKARQILVDNGFGDVIKGSKPTVKKEKKKYAYFIIHDDYLTYSLTRCLYDNGYKVKNCDFTIYSSPFSEYYDDEKGAIVKAEWDNAKKLLKSNGFTIIETVFAN